MSSVMKYWSILESLQFPEIGVPRDARPNSDERVLLNVKQIQEAIQLSPVEVTQQLIEKLKLHHFDYSTTDINEHTDSKYLYTIYLLHVLGAICNEVNFSGSNKEELVSERHRSLAIAAIEDIVECGLKSNLHSTFYGGRKESIFGCCSPCNKHNFYRLELIVAAFSPLVYVQSLYTTKILQDFTLYYMAAVYSLLFAFEDKQHQINQTHMSGGLQTNLQRIWTEVSKTIYYRNLMLLYATLPTEKKQKIHKDMLLKLWSSGGFMALVFAMHESKENEGKPVSPQIVCTIVAQPSFPSRAQQSLVKQILQIIEGCPNNAELMPHMGLCLLTLKEMCNNRKDNKDMVLNWLRQQLVQLLDIEEGRITVMEFRQFADLISLLFQMFCTSTIECLPSELLLPYLPLLITCHMQIRLCGTTENQVCSQLCALILNILNNRQKQELESIIKFVALNSYPQNWLRLHHRIVIEENPVCAQELRIIQKEAAEPNVCISSNMFALAVILKESSFNIVLFQVFMSLFRLLPSSLDVNGKSCKDSGIKNYLLTDDELEDNAIRNNLQMYELKLDVIKSLELLLHHKTLKTLINENISEILKVLQEILIAYSLPNAESEIETDDSVVMVLLVLIGEIVQGCSSSKLDEVRRALLSPLMRLKGEVNNENLKYKIISLEKQIPGETFNAFNDGSSEAELAEARSLLQSTEPYEHVQGIQKLIRLIDAKDKFILSNVHIITTLALNTLNSAESYTFLNCVRLFVSLVNVNAPEVLDILVDEYSDESSNKDYRLIVGEALLKVCQQLGPLCYNYKGLLLNCYMCGCRSAFDEFRFSSFSNLAQMCRILSYQVQSFFQELLQLIDCELTTGKYLPAQRAAVMVLGDLLQGMDNLYDYEEMLLPIYRLLKYLASSENTDEKIRLHATAGLENLSAKCKQLLTASIQRPLEKHIEIMGIGNTQSKRKLKDHILYMD